MVGDDEIDLSLKDPVTVKELSVIVAKIMFLKLFKIWPAFHKAY